MSTGLPTVAHLLDTYEREVLPSLAPTTQYQQHQLFLFFRCQFGERLLTDLTPAYLRLWRDHLAKTHKPGTVRRYLDALSGPLSFAVEQVEWLSSNPLGRVQKPPESPWRARFLSDEERSRLLAMCQDSANPHLYAVVLLALTTGARKNELLTLRWADVDLQQGVIRLGKTKTKLPRVVPLKGEIRYLLQKRSQGQASEAWVFPRPDLQKPLLIEAAWRTARARAKLPGFRFHDLRHTAASYLAMSGASLIEIAEILGHRSMAMVRRYAHLSQSHLHGVIGKMAEQFRLYGWVLWGLWVVLGL
jgi:integrase